MSIGQEIIDGLKDFAESLKDGTVLKKHRVTKLVKLDDGTYKRVVSDPQEGITVQIVEDHTQDR